MTRTVANRILFAGLLCAASAFAQVYPPGTAGSGTPGSPGAPSYKSSTGIAIGAAAAAGIGITYLVVHERSGISGCVANGADGQMRLVGNNSSDSYMLLNSAGVSLQPGERVKLRGKRTKDASGQRVLEVQRLAKTYGPCQL